jgi:hypothetical protein
VSGPALIRYQKKKKMLSESKLSNVFGGGGKKNKKLDPPGDIMYLGFPILSVLVAVPKGVPSKQMAAVAMDKNGNP